MRETERATPTVNDAILILDMRLSKSGEVYSWVSVNCVSPAGSLRRKDPASSSSLRR
jgi:hypothetical protein